MRVTDEDIWNFSDEHRQALRGIQRFLVSVEGVRLWTDFVAGKMPEDRSALPPIPGLRPALRRRLPTEAQRTAHQKKARSPTRARDVDESPAKRLRSASASARRKSPAARSPRRRERSPDRQQRARSPPASRRRRSPSSDRPIPVPQGLSDYTGPERFMPAVKDAPHCREPRQSRRRRLPRRRLRQARDRALTALLRVKRRRRRHSLL